MCGVKGNWGVENANETQNLAKEKAADPFTSDTILLLGVYL
jgi:hypothetical protein